MIISSVGSHCNKQNKPEFLSRLQKEKPFLEIGFHPSRCFRCVFCHSYHLLKADSLYKCSLDFLCVLYSTFIYIKALKVQRQRGTESRMTAHWKFCKRCLFCTVLIAFLTEPSKSRAMHATSCVKAALGLCNNYCFCLTHCIDAFWIFILSSFFFNCTPQSITEKKQSVCGLL